MKAPPKTELSGNMSCRCSVTVIVSRVHQDAGSLRSVQKRKQSKTKLECGHEENVYLLQLRVAFSGTKENLL